MNRIVELFIKDRITAGTVLLYLVLFGTLVGLDQEGQILNIIKLIEHTQLARTALLLLLTCAFLLVLFARAYNKEKIDLTGYRFDEQSGLYEHIKSGQFVCTSCLLNKKIHSPVKASQKFWHCQIIECNKLYPNPGYNPPPEQRRVLSEGIRRW